VLVGRTVATIAELAFVAQWAIVLHRLGELTETKIAQKLSLPIVPLIIVAECFSWYAVIRTDYLGNAFEESIWAFTYVLIGFSLASLYKHFRSPFRYAIAFSILGCIIYVTFMVTVDVPMYLNRWQLDIASQKPLLGFFEGLNDLNSRWVVSRDMKDWIEEIPWKTLYFSVAVWASLALCYVPLTRERIKKYLSHK
jgi:hypothetical protein